MKDWHDILKKSTPMSEEYKDAMNGIKEALGDVYETSKEFITNDFVANHLEDIAKVAEGEEGAIESLRLALAKDIAVNAYLDYTGLDANSPEVKAFESKIDALKAMMDDPNNQIKVGTRIDLSTMEGDQEQFLKACQDIINSAHMTAEEANAFFDSMGFETTFVTEQKPITKEGHETITETREIGKKGFPNYDLVSGEITGYTWIPITSTRTYPGAAYSYTDYVDAIAMDTAPDGKGQVPKIESITRKATGSMNNASSLNRGGGGSSGGGSGSKSTTTKTKTADRYHEITAKIQQNQAELNKLNTAKDRAFGPEKLGYMDQEIALLETQAELYKELYKEAQNYYEMDKAALEEYGATFNPDGTIANYDAWYQTFLDKYNSGEMDDDA